MLDLLTSFTPGQIVVYGVILIIAIKGTWDVSDYFKGKYENKFNKDFMRKQKEKALEENYKTCAEQHQESVKLHNELKEQIDILSRTINEKFDDLDKRLDQLNENDKHVIKQTLVKDYHYFVEEEGWIDDFNLDSILLLYSDYKKLGGNSYVHDLIDKIKDLPHQPPH